MTFTNLLALSYVEHHAMPDYRPIGIEDPRFPDGRGLLLAWTCEFSDDRERTLYLFTSAQRFFVHRHELGDPRAEQHSGGHAL